MSRGDGRQTFCAYIVFVEIKFIFGIRNLNQLNLETTNNAFPHEFHASLAPALSPPRVPARLSPPLVPRRRPNPPTPQSPTIATDSCPPR